MVVAGVELKGAKVLVIGLARSGLAALRLLSAQGAILTACDTMPLAELAGAAQTLNDAGAAFFAQSPDVAIGQQLVVTSPGVPIDVEPLLRARAAGIPVIGEMELAGYFLQGPNLVITATNGKTTTTAQTGHILTVAGIANQVGGNIGTPPASMVDNSRSNQWNVLEASSFQLETISGFHARIGVCLNVTQNHLDRHHTMDAYISAKGRLFQTQTKDDYAVLNADDAICVRYASMTPARPLWFSLARPVTPGLWLDTGTIWFDGERMMQATEIPLRGLHNVENTLAASAAARLAGASLDAIAAGVRTFTGVEHRLEHVRTVGGVDYYNDSKATTVDAALKALDTFGGGVWIILGGKDKGSDYTPLREPLREKARAALLIGAAAAKIGAKLEGAVKLVECGTLDAAVEYACAHASSGDTVLLAPACASFDQFQNFEHRGAAFKQLVAQIEERT